MTRWLKLHLPQLPGLLARTLAYAGFVFLIAPMLVIAPIAFSSGTFMSYPIPGFSLRWFETVFTPYPWGLAFQNSIIIAVSTMILSTILGTLAAWGIDRLKWRYKTALTGLLVAPAVVPSVIVALALYFFFARVHLLGSIVAVILAHTMIAVPLVLITVSASLKSFDHNLVKAAASLGASPRRTFIDVVLPQIGPGVGAGAVFAFITSFDELIIALFLTGPSQITLPRQLFSGLRNQLDPSIIAVSVLLTTFTLSLLVIVLLFRALSRRGGRE